jgi:chemotaxis protein CheD
LNDNHYFLYSSQLFVSLEPIIVKTLLGSCVSVCLWDSVKKIGGINHYMLPLWNGEGLPSPKYGNIAIEKLLDKMMHAGCRKVNIKAKVFGGAENLSNQENNFKVGHHNVLLAETLLNSLHIPIVAKSVGGYLGRNIQFNTYSGEILLKYIKKELFRDK